MRIADIRVTNLLFDYPGRRGFTYAGGTCTSRVTSLIEVETEDHRIGLGTVYSHPDLVRLIVEGHLKPLLLGADPAEVEALWRMMYAQARWYGRKGAAVSALGGLDIAFWDLRAQAAGKPLRALLGADRDRVPAYASGLLWQDDVERLAAEAARHLDHGFRRVKMRLGRGWDYDRAALAAVLRGLDGRGQVMVDGSHRYSLDGAERIGRLLEQHRVFWFEEPFAPEDIDSYVALRTRLRVPLAAGENEFGVQGFRELLRAGAIDIAQADACRCGGISEAMRVGRMAAAFGARLAPHTWSDAVAVIANAHVVAALDNGVTVEVDQTGNPFIEALLAEPLRIVGGMLALPSAPGLGIALDRATLARLTLPADRPVPDGAYSDLAFGRAHLIEPPAYVD